MSCGVGHIDVRRFFVLVRLGFHDAALERLNEKVGSNATLAARAHERHPECCRLIATPTPVEARDGLGVRRSDDDRQRLDFLVLVVHFKPRSSATPRDCGPGRSRFNSSAGATGARDDLRHEARSIGAHVVHNAAFQQFRKYFADAHACDAIGLAHLVAGSQLDRLPISLDLERAIGANR
ncbi:MAG: hypothetical protein QM756_44770 [Polyangiaceae bacterium]